MNADYEKWLRDHLAGANAHYLELSKRDDQVLAEGNESSAYYEQAQQMFGYIAALEKCLRELTAGPNSKVPVAKKMLRSRR